MAQLWWYSNKAVLKAALGTSLKKKLLSYRENNMVFLSLLLWHTFEALPSISVTHSEISPKYRVSQKYALQFLQGCIFFLHGKENFNREPDEFLTDGPKLVQQDCNVMVGAAKFNSIRLPLNLYHIHN